MVSKKVVSKWALVACVMFVAVCVLFPLSASAQEDNEEGAEAAGGLSVGDGLRALGLAIGAGLAVGIAGFGTGHAQASVGAGGTGAIAENPQLFINVLILFAIPETIVLFGFVIAILLFNLI